MINSLLADYLSYNKDTGELAWKKKASSSALVGTIAGCVNNYGYVHIGLKGKQYKSHRVAWFLYYGVEPILDIDHINGVTTDNRISNLREVSHLENGKNMRLSKANKSGHQGIYLKKKTNTWRAIIGVNNIQIELGTFKTLDEAIKARKLANIKHGFHKNHGIKPPEAHKDQS